MKNIILATTYLIAATFIILISGCEETNPAVVPIISTSAISGITSSTASSGGSISSDGGATITARGVCYSVTNQTPTTADNKTTDGTGTGNFISNLTNLTANSIYYVRAYTTNSVGTSYGSVMNFTTSPPDIYVAGYEINASGNSVAKYWKNGKAVSLTDGTKRTIALSIFINDEDVYVAGYENEHATYWKNGTIVSLTNGIVESVAYSVVANGADVFVAGYENNPNGDPVARYWKNGVTTYLLNEPGKATAISVNGADIYIAGSGNDGYFSVAKYWKNGTVINLTDGLNPAYATSIFVDGQDVYIAGYEINNNTGINVV